MILLEKTLNSSFKSQPSYLWFFFFASLSDNASFSDCEYEEQFNSLKNLFTIKTLRTWDWPKKFLKNPCLSFPSPFLPWITSSTNLTYEGHWILLRNKRVLKLFYWPNFILFPFPSCFPIFQEDHLSSPTSKIAFSFRIFIWFRNFLVEFNKVVPEYFSVKISFYQIWPSHNKAALSTHLLPEYFFPASLGLTSSQQPFLEVFLPNEDKGKNSWVLVSIIERLCYFMGWKLRSMKPRKIEVHAIALFELKKEIWMQL